MSPVVALDAARERADLKRSLRDAQANVAAASDLLLGAALVGNTGDRAGVALRLSIAEHDLEAALVAVRAASAAVARGAL